MHNTSFKKKMNQELSKVKESTIVPSVLQSDELFSSKILARQSTVGSCSSRFFYRAAEGVPFQWEKRPGKPIENRPDEALPPLTPPPARFATSLPKPCMNNFMGESTPRRWSSAWFIKKIKKIKMEGYKTYNTRTLALGGEKKQSSKSKFGSERFVCESGRSSTSSLGSSSTSSSNVSSFGDHKQSSNGNNPTYPSNALVQSKPFTCGPRRLNDIVVHFVKRS